MIANIARQSLYRRQPDDRHHTLPRIMVRMQAVTTPRPQMQPTVYLPSPRAYVDLAPGTER